MISKFNLLIERHGLETFKKWREDIGKEVYGF
jgi:hypothetical protein